MNFKNIITLTQVSDGAPGAPGDGSGVGYYIETNQEEVLRFKNVAGQYTYSPSVLTFKIYNYPKQDNSEQLELTNSSFRLEVQTSDGFEEVEKGEILRLGYIAYEEGTEEKEELDLNTVYFNVSSFYAIRNQQVENSQNFRFSFLIDGSIASIKIIQMRNGVSEDMAKLNLHASGIDASIQSNRLKFSAEGLSMYKVQDSEFGPQLDEVFGFRDGDLYLKGRLDAATGTFRGELEAATGTFSGELQAATGSFSGHLQAKTGQIGGFTIGEDSLYSGENIENSPLVLKAGDGANSEIIADNITLGIGARIKDRLIFAEDVFLKENTEIIENKEIKENFEFNEEDSWVLKSREAYINNPNLYDGVFIEAGETLLTSEGFLKLGEIEAFGGDEKRKSYIKAGEKTSSSFWEINGDGTAKFKEIVVDKATIKDSVLEIGTVQAVGSMMLFKDSWKIIDKREEIISTLEDSTSITKLYFYTLETSIKDEMGNFIINLNEGDLISTGGSDFFKVLSKEGNEIALVTNLISIGDIITKIGKDQDFLISILGDSTGGNSYATENSLTLSIVKATDTSIDFEKILVLGDLSKLDLSDKINYETGLYAKNVYLKGSLVTEIEEQSYAGINTLDGVSASIFKEKGIKTENDYYDESKIVIWAGARTDSEEGIQNANFQVTEKGSIYAYQGVFEGSLITDSVIKGASIHTAKIYGEQDEEEAALKIYDAANGIQFIKQRGLEKEEVHFGIKNEGIYTKNNRDIILIEESEDVQVKFIADSIKINSNEDSNIIITNNKINFNVDNSTFFEGINSKGEMVLGKIENEKENEFFILTQSEVISPQSFSARKDILFGVKGENGSLHYQKTDHGYDLYVSYKEE